MTTTNYFTYLANNPHLLCRINTSYWDNKGVLQEDVKVSGFLKSGFGRDFSTDWGSFIEVSGAQQAINQLAQGANILGSAFGTNRLGSLNVAIESVIQTVQTFKKQPVPEFSISLLFFDANGSGKPLEYAKTLELTQIALPQYIDNSNYNFALKPPMGYQPMPRDSKSSKNINKKFTMTAKGLTTLYVGNYAMFDDLIITGVQNTFSDIILDSGTPMWVESNIKFKYWRLPEQAHIYSAYSTGNT